jgi:hypothetical protein
MPDLGPQEKANTGAARIKTSYTPSPLAWKKVS